VHRLGSVHERLLLSRYIRSHHVVPDLDTLDDEGYVRVLADVGRKIGSSAVLFPITDLHVLRVSRLRPRLEAEFKVTTTDAAGAETLVNKRLFFQALAARGVDHPDTRFPESPEEFEAAAKEIGYPIYLKPEISPLFNQAFQTKGLVAKDPEELRAHAGQVFRSGLKVMLQEIIPGDATAMHGCAGYRRGREVVWVCYRRVREFPAGFGCGSMLETCPSFVHQTRLLEFLESINYQGLFDAEFKLDPRRGTYCLIEINARSWWQNLLPTESGINLIELAYLDATGLGRNRPLPAPDYAIGVKWIHLYNDFYAARESGMGIGTWVRSLSGKKVFAFFAFDDPFPKIVKLSIPAWSKFRKIVGFKSRVDGAGSLRPAPPSTKPAKQR